MPKPNQISVNSFASRQGIYVPYIRVYDEEPGKYGLMCEDFYLNFKTRDRARAIARGREMAKLLKGKTPDETREFLRSNCVKSWLEVVR